MPDPFHEYEDRLLCEEHAAHPERFHKYPIIMKDRFLKHLNSISDQKLFYACREILDIPEFFTWPASLSFHHAYEGGLLTHTVEVCDLVKGISASYGLPPHADPNAMQKFEDILIASALWHDVMKTEEYQKVSKIMEGQRGLLIPGHFPNDQYWVSTPYTGEIHHIQGSAIEFTVAARNHGVSPYIINKVVHCILAHHGRREWGSPVEPKSLEALILHQADMLSAKFGATKDKP